MQPIHFHATDKQRQFLQWASAATGLSRAELIREALDSRYGPWMDMDMEIDTAMDMDVAAAMAMDGHGAPDVTDWFNRDLSGKDGGVETKRVADAGLVGTRGKVGERLADEVARRTHLSAGTLKTIVGSYLVLSRVRSLVKMVRRYRASG